MARQFSPEADFETAVAAIEMLACEVADHAAVILMLLDLYRQGKRSPDLVFKKISASVSSLRSSSRLLSDAARSIVQIMENLDAREKSG